MASIRSYFSPTTKQAIEEDNDFTNRKRINEDSKSFYATKVLVKIFSFKPNLYFQLKYNLKKWCTAAIYSIKIIISKPSTLQTWLMK